MAVQKQKGENFRRKQPAGVDPLVFILACSVVIKVLPCWKLEKPCWPAICLADDEVVDEGESQDFAPSVIPVGS